jgi:hypothetical protein
MDKLIDLAGHVASYVGVLVCLFAGGVRVVGLYSLSGVSVQSMFVLGMAFMIFACLAKLHVLSRRP